MQSHTNIKPKYNLYHYYLAINTKSEVLIYEQQTNIKYRNETVRHRHRMQS